MLGDYSLTLIDSLDTLAVLGDAPEFRKAVQRVIEDVSFDLNTTVQVFEANIRWRYDVFWGETMLFVGVRGMERCFFGGGTKFFEGK